MSGRTRHCFARAVGMLIEHFDGRDPREFTEDELQDYFLFHRNDCNWSSSTLKIHYCGLRFFFINVLLRECHIFNIFKAQKERRLTCVLSREEVCRTLRHVKTFHNYCYLSAFYVCGLRLQEGLFLQVSDIDKDRMQIHSHRGKGVIGRFVPLPQETLLLLRRYWKTRRNAKLIFPALGRGHQNGPSAKSPMAADSVQGAMRRAGIAAG